MKLSVVLGTSTAQNGTVGMHRAEQCSGIPEAPRSSSCPYAHEVIDTHQIWQHRHRVICAAGEDLRQTLTKKNCMVEHKKKSQPGGKRDLTSLCDRGQGGSGADGNLFGSIGLC